MIIKNMTDKELVNLARNKFNFFLDNFIELQSRGYKVLLETEFKNKISKFNNETSDITYLDDITNIKFIKKENIIL